MNTNDNYPDEFEQNSISKDKLFDGHETVGKQSVIGLNQCGFSTITILESTKDTCTSESMNQQYVVKGSTSYVDDHLNYVEFSETGYNNFAVNLPSKDYRKCVCRINQVDVGKYTRNILVDACVGFIENLLTSKSLTV